MEKILIGIGLFMLFYFILGIFAYREYLQAEARDMERGIE